MKANWKGLKTGEYIPYKLSYIYKSPVLSPFYIMKANWKGLKQENNILKLSKMKLNNATKRDFFGV